MESKARAANPEWWLIIREGFLEEVTFNTEPRGPIGLARQDWSMNKILRI